MTFQKNAPATGDKSGQGGIVSSDKNYTTIKETAKQLKINGYEILAINHYTKTPSHKWKEADKRPNLNRLLQKFPNKGVGVFLGTEIDGHRLIAIDVDIYDRELSQKVADYCFKHFGDPPVRIGQKPKFMAFYLCKGIDNKITIDTIQQNKSGKNSHIEVLTAGQYAVIHGYHEKTKKPYTWRKDSLLNTPLKDLPKIDKSDIDRLLEKFCIDKKSQSLGSEFNQPAPPQDAFETMCLTDEKRVDWSHGKINHFINNLNPNMGHDDWLQIGMALHFQFNGAPEGLEIWDQWSQGSGKYKQGEPQRRWDSFKNGQEGDINNLVGFPTLIKKYSHHNAESTLNQTGFLTLSEIRQAPLETKWVVDGFLDDGSTSVFYADPGSHKTFIALDLSLHIASGRHWHGYPITKQGLVIYINAEGKNGFMRRVNGWEKANGKAPDKNFVASSHGYSLLEKQSLNQLSEHISAIVDSPQTVSLIVIDTLNANFGSANENEAGDMGAFFRVIENLKAQYNCSALVIHHTNKTGDFRGSNVIAGNVDNLAKITVGKDNLTSLEFRKFRDGEKPEKLYFEMNTVELGVTTKGKILRTLVPILKDSPIQEFNPLNKDTAKGRFFQFINDKFQEQRLNDKSLLKFSDIQSQFCKETGTKENTARKYKSEFLNTDINAITINEKGELTGVKEW